MGMHLGRSRDEVAEYTTHRDIVHRQQHEFQEETEKAEAASEQMEQVDDGINQEYHVQKEEAYQLALEQISRASEAVKAEQTELKENITKDMTDLSAMIEKCEQNSGNKYYKHLEKAVNKMKEYYKEYQNLLSILEQALECEVILTNENEVISALTWNREIAQIIAQKEQEIQAIPSLITASDQEEEAFSIYSANKSQIENAMRNGSPFMNEESAKAVENLHSLLSDKRLNRELTVYAPLNGDNFNGLSKLSDDELTGKIIADGSFMHTSIQEKYAGGGDSVLVLNLPKGTAATVINVLDDNAHADPLPCTDINLATKLGLQNGVVEKDIFKKDATGNLSYQKGMKLEDMSIDLYETLQVVDPAEASRVLTDYNARHIPAADWHDAPRKIDFERGSIQITDSELKAEYANITDDFGNTYVAYPNPMTRVNNMFGHQGKNNIGMQEDCGIASTAKAINDLYGTTVTTENRLGNYAKDNWLCEWIPSNVQESGGTWESTVKDLYDANGLAADAYIKERVPDLDSLAERIKNGEAATLAVCSDIFWRYNPTYHVPGNYAADHYVNISNVVYDSKGNLSHFIVCDTGDGRTKMVSKNDLERAYKGGNGIHIDAAGCVVGRRTAETPKPVVNSMLKRPSAGDCDMMLDFQQAFKITNVEKRDGKRYIYADALFHN